MINDNYFERLCVWCGKRIIVRVKRNGIGVRLNKNLIIDQLLSYCVDLYPIYNCRYTCIGLCIIVYSLIHFCVQIEFSQLLTLVRFLHLARNINQFDI